MLARLRGWHTSLGVLAFIVGLAFTLDARFAKAVDLAQLASDVYHGQLKSDRRALRAEETTLRSIPEREKRSLTQYEQQRLQEVQEELRAVDRDLEQRKRR